MARSVEREDEKIELYRILYVCLIRDVGVFHFYNPLPSRNEYLPRQKDDGIFALIKMFQFQKSNFFLINDSFDVGKFCWNLYHVICRNMQYVHLYMIPLRTGRP